MEFCIISTAEELERHVGSDRFEVLKSEDRRTHSGCRGIRYEHVLEVVEVYAHCEDAAHNNASNDHTDLSNVEAVKRAVD